MAQLATGGHAGLGLLGELPESAVYCPRVVGLGFNPNPVGVVLAAASAAAYGWFLLNRGGWTASALALAPFFVTLLGLLATRSRAALMGLVLAISVVSLVALIGQAGARWTS